MGDPSRDAADRRQPLPRCHLPGESVGALASLSEPAPCFVQCCHDAVELALSGGGQRRQFGNIVRLERGLDLQDMARPFHR